MIGDGGFVGGILVLSHRRFESTDTFSDPFAEFGKFLRSEYEQSNSKHHQQMRELQESLEHKYIENRKTSLTTGVNMLTPSYFGHHVQPKEICATHSQKRECGPQNNLELRMHSRL